MVGPKKVLILDDEMVILDLFNEVFQEAGYEVITTESPAMAVIKAQVADVVVLDLNMNDRNEKLGLDVLVHIWGDKENTTPIIIFSAYANFQETINEIKEIEEIYGQGRKVHACIPKSDGMSLLIETVDKLFGVEAT